jgi:hypothetical protein
MGIVPCGDETGFMDPVAAEQAHRGVSCYDPADASHIRTRPPMQLQSMLTCPQCRHQAIEHMLLDACQFFYVCKGCGEKLKPLAGDCCVFCSYGSVPCPPVQENGKSGCCG